MLKDKFINNLSISGYEVSNASDRVIYQALASSIQDIISQKWIKSKNNYEKQSPKQMFYLSAEFLMGRSLGNNLINLGVLKEVEDLCQELNLDLDSLMEQEADAGLGNGGLGRLAACFLDSLSTLNLAGHGYGLRYEYGLFKQKIEYNQQVEYPDNWLNYPDVWSVEKKEEEQIISFGGYVENYFDEQGNLNYCWKPTSFVKAIPFDTYIVGYHSENINTLRLWKSESVKGFNFSAFNQMQLLESVRDIDKCENITRVLYPNDSVELGKELRLKQQYFLVSASLKDLIFKFKKKKISFSEFPNFHVLQLNDTHPTLAILELMRLLLDEEKMSWDDSWNICQRTFAYTNHTILSEALEKWPIDLFSSLLPRSYQIVEEINRRFLLDLEANHHDLFKNKSYYSIIGNGQVRMAWLAIVCCFSVNGVARLHTDILKEYALKDWYSLYPNKFNNKTNGVTQRRWLLLANPKLSEWISDKVGDVWLKEDMKVLERLRDFKNDSGAIKEILSIKQKNKDLFISYFKKEKGIELSNKAIFDVQVKRIHEYKRQFLNILHIVYLYFELKENPDTIKTPIYFFFGGKAAPGYRRAKNIIYYINSVAEVINNDAEVKDKIKVIFLENYSVSLAEKIIPASDVSQQISTAGKEASGTGNMKFMMNGAITLGTLDGANIEIVEEVGKENAFIFGLKTEEVEGLLDSHSYHPYEVLEGNLKLKKVVETLIDGTFSDGNKDAFRELYNSLIYGVEGSPADQYLVLKDFDSYREAHKKMRETYEDSSQWGLMSLLNIAGSGRFSSDNTIREYAKDIWGINPIKPQD